MEPSNWTQATAQHRCPLCGVENFPNCKPVVEITPSGAGYCGSCGRVFTVDARWTPKP